MQVCIAIMHGNPVMLELREGVPYINDEPQPIKHLTEDDLVAFHEAVSAIPDDGDPHPRQGLIPRFEKFGIEV